MNVKRAIEHLNHSETILMDYGLVNEQPSFVLRTGFDAYVSTEFAKGKHRGICTYLENIIKGFSNINLSIIIFRGMALI